MQDTDIEWCDKSCNPFKLELPDGNRINACVKISPGCAFCYAETVARRWWRKDWKQKYGEFPGYTKALFKIGKPVLVEEELHDVLKLSARIAAGKADPSKNKIFWNDVTDEYLEFWPDEFRVKVWAVRALTRNLIHQVLTKRTEAMAAYLLRTSQGVDAAGHGCKEAIADAIIHWHTSQEKSGYRLSNILPIHPLRIAQDVRHWETWPLPNVWLMTSVENQKQANERIPHLLKCPAAVRGLSIEPLLEPIDLRGKLIEWRRDGSSFFHPVPHSTPRTLIDWVIVGCESKGARPGRFVDGYEAAARSIINQCKAAGVAVFHKQMPINGKVSGEPSEWQEDLRARKFPNAMAEVSA